MNFIKRIYNDYICVRLSDYNGFDSELQINKLLFFVFLGLAAACMLITYYNGASTLILKKLARTGAFSEDKSKNLNEIGLGSSRAVKILLRNKSGALKSLIIVKGSVKLSYEEYTELEKSKKQLRKLSKEEKKKKLSEINEKLNPTLNFEEASFYIPEDKREAAERFISDKSTTFSKGLINCGVLLAFYVAIALLMPSLLSFVSKIIAK